MSLWMPLRPRAPGTPALHQNWTKKDCKILQKLIRRLIHVKSSMPNCNQLNNFNAFHRISMHLTWSGSFRIDTISLQSSGRWNHWSLGVSRFAPFARVGLYRGKWHARTPAIWVECHQWQEGDPCPSRTSRTSGVWCWEVCFRFSRVFGNIFSCFGEFTMGHQGGHQSILPQATSWLELAYCDHCGRQLAEAADQLGVGFPIDPMFSNGCHVICQETISRQFCCVRFWENTTLRSPRSRSTSEHVGARRVCSSCKRKEYVLPASCLTCRAVPATCAWYSACPNFCFQEVTKLEIHTSRHQVSPRFQHVSTLHSEF